MKADATFVLSLSKKINKKKKKRERELTDYSISHSKNSQERSAGHK